MVIINNYLKAINRCSLKNAKRCYSKNLNNRKWESIVGLEVHAQIATASKLFSESSTAFSSPVNSNVSFFDCSTPGTLPVLNKKCVEAGVLTALALNCRVNAVSMFDRKHYFYADIPAGYQITQQRYPLANDGKLEFQVFTPGYHKVPYKTKARIKQLQLEQDSGKSLHDFDRSLVDLNRAGMPLMELVFEPDLCDGEEAAALVKELAIILQSIGTCSCKMEEGALRVDANVSIHRHGEPLGIRTEIKNIGSVRAVAGAVRYEIERQLKLKESGGLIVNETRAWDPISKATVPMRDKEQQQDYRYMPEPNLPPLHLDMGPVKHGCVSVDELKKKIPELPEQTRVRLQKEHGLTLEQSFILVNDRPLLELYNDTICKRTLPGKLVGNILINDLTSLLHKLNKDFTDINIDGDIVGEIIDLLQNATINRNTVKYLLSEAIEGNKTRPFDIVKQNNLMQITDESELTKLCQNVLIENQKIVDDYKAGKTKVFRALLGIVHSKSGQRADMGKCNKILLQLLNNK